MDSLKFIKSALETRLKAMPNGLATAWENVSFDPPAEAYQRADMLPAAPENPTLGDGFYRERGLFQITLFYPLDGGGGVVYAMAEAVRSWFPRGLSLVSGGVTVRIPSTGAIGPHFRENDRFALPVRIRYFADIVQ